MHIIALTQAAILIDQEFGDDENRNPLDPGRGIKLMEEDEFVAKLDAYFEETFKD